MSNIGIVGLGYVGTAISKGLEGKFEIETYDKYKKSTCTGLAQLCAITDTIFVCVPTPMKPSGECDISIVKSVIYELNKYCKDHIIILKSTVPPTTTERFNKDCKQLTIVFSPEFLTEANYINDFIECNRIILGGPEKSTLHAKNIFLQCFPNKIYIRTDSTTAEIVKYIGNTFLATKVSFANEIKQVCDALNVDYNEVIEYAKLDSRLGPSHWAVPGPDGNLGFGGSCFPKDINALISLAEEKGLQPKVLRAAWNKNLEIRPERDWEDLIGRAISKGEKNE
jgi:UDPglucose 6-dehydrogenase